MTAYAISSNGTTGKFKESLKATGPIEGSVDGLPFAGSGALTGKGAN